MFLFIFRSQCGIFVCVFNLEFLLNLGIRKGDINIGDQIGDVKELGRVEYRRYGGGE